MFTQIVVPLDGSKESAAALPTAGALARRTGATLGLLHVINRSAPRDTTAARQRSAARQWLRQAADAVQMGDEPVTIAVREGLPAPEILTFAEESEADLICMATRARTGLHRVIVGSVAERVLHDARVPVLLVRPDMDAARFPAGAPIVVPLDGSLRAEAALPYATRLADALGAPLTLVRVWNTATPIIPTGPYAGEMDELLLDETQDAAEEAVTAYLEGVAERVPAAVPARAVHLRGGAAERLTAYLRDTRPALVVMGAHGRGGVARWVLGSVAVEMVRAAIAPILLIGDACRRGATEDEEGQTTRN